MIRFLLFITSLILPLIFGWWLFIPICLVSVYLIKFPYEIIFVGFILDFMYYFGVGFWYENALLIFSFVVLVLASILNRKINWKKTI